MNVMTKQISRTARSARHALPCACSRSTRWRTQNPAIPARRWGMAEVAAVLWRRYLRHNPANPAWPDRDRFVLSNGHASMLLYALLHLTGYDLPLAELKRFRQLHSKTPGHPELGVTPGVETTTGPLGQGFANAVGMALAEKTARRAVQPPGHTIVDHRTFVFVGDGCLMEGISHEAASLAGPLGLGKLVALYDDNGISIDGQVEEWFADDTPKRFEAYGWHVMRDVDGHDPTAVDAALAAAIVEAARPSLVCCKTVIGRGAPTKAGSPRHARRAARRRGGRARRAELDWPYAPFEIPDAVAEAWDARRQGAAIEADWNRRFEHYQAAYPDLAKEFTRRVSGELAGRLRRGDRRVCHGGRGEGRGAGNAQGEPERARGVRPRITGTLRRLGRSGTFEPDHPPAQRSRSRATLPAIHIILRRARVWHELRSPTESRCTAASCPMSATFLVFSDYAATLFA